jgi:lysophospholipase L1-like esterase
VGDAAALIARIGRLSLAYAEACAALGVPYLETYTPLLRSQVWQTEARAGDGAHPAAAGYAAMAALVMAWPAWLAWLR